MKCGPISAERLQKRVLKFFNKVFLTSSQPWVKGIFEPTFLLLANFTGETFMMQIPADFLRQF